MKTGLLLGSLLLVSLIVGGCASGSASSGTLGGTPCLSRPDYSGTQPMLYLLCIQSS